MLGPRSALVPLVDLGTWFSPRFQPPSCSASVRPPKRAGLASARSGVGSGEQGARHRHIGHLEDDVTSMAHDPGADLHELLAQSRERPLRDRVGQRQRAQGSWPGCRRVPNNCSRTALSRKAPHRAVASRSASFPSLIHCSAVPRPTPMAGSVLQPARDRVHQVDIPFTQGHRRVFGRGAPGPVSSSAPCATDLVSVRTPEPYGRSEHLDQLRRNPARFGLIDQE